MGQATIEDYHAALDAGDRAICDRLREIIAGGLPEAESKVWHAHPVWFIAGNPVVGYGKLKGCVRLLFWSGQSFAAPGLVPEGTFKAAERRYRDVAEVDAGEIGAWLDEARVVQWDYRNIVKRKGRLERIG
jgi:hypothetical protein